MSEQEQSPRSASSGSGNRELYERLRNLDTEQRNQASQHIDTADPLEIAQIINAEDHRVADAVQTRLPVIAEAMEAVKETLDSGGRLIYMGAGTSGRLGVLDAAECPPTFGSDPAEIIGLIAGGREAMFVAQEGAEDFESNGKEALQEINLTTADLVCGLAASGRTPYVIGGLKYAQQLDCRTIFVCTVPGDQVRVACDFLIDIPVGPEVVMGSTRMKSATAQKMVLNMLTTGAMIRRGKVYENVMVDLMLTNKKLRERSKRIIAMFTSLTYEQAGSLLKQAGGHVKTALVMELAKVGRSRAQELLDQQDGFVERAIEAAEA
ncbi:MAG: N-acetylmuramic acid 6-phosphate etherase [Bacteroidota bacterium]